MHKTTRDKRTLKLSYLAGFFDGEGSIFIAKMKNKKSGNDWYRLNVSCANSEREPIDMLNEFSLTRKPLVYRPKRKSYYKPSYQWLSTGNVALNFLQIIIPYLKVKKKQARIAIEFQKWRSSLPRTGKKRPQDIIRKYELYRQKLKKLNLSKEMYLQSQRLSEETPSK